MALSTNLVAYYKLDGNSNDSVGSNNGTDTSVSYSTSYGKINQGASFNGSSSYINLNNKIASGTAITVSCWIYSLSASQAQDVTIFSNQNDTNTYGIVFSRNTATANQWGMFYGDGSGHWYTYNANYFTISANTWHHLVCTINGNVVYVYLDGTQVINYSGGANVNFTNSNNFTLGLDSAHTAGRYFNGYIDEVGIWSRALSSTEVSQLYNGGAGLQYPFGNAYTLAVTVGSFVLTGISALFTKAMRIATTVGNFTLTGVNVAFRLGKGIAAGVGSFILTGNPANLVGPFRTVWTDINKPTTTWTDGNKPSTTWTDITKGQ